MTTPSMSIVKGSATNAAAGSAITESRGVLSVVLGKEAPMPLAAGQVNKIKAQSGQHWKLVREQADKTGAVATDNVIATGQGDDLVLRYEDGTLVTVEGFFAVCADASVCSVNLPGDAAEGFTLSGDSARGVVLGEEGTLLYAHGTPDVLRTMAQGQPKLSTALSGLGEAPMVTYLPTSDSVGVGNFTSNMLGLLGAGGAVAVAAGGSGGGNSTPVPDITAPTVVITDDEATPTGNLAGGDITYTFTFSEGVTGFTAADVVVANGSKGTFTAVSATVYTLVVTPTAGFVGNVTVDVAAGVAQDTAGNNNTAAVQSVQAVDMLAPTAPTAVTLTPSGGTVVSNTLNASNTALAFQATITAGQATGGSAVFKVDGVTVGSDSSIGAGDTSVTFSTSDGTPTSAEVQSAIAAGGVVTVELIDAAGNTVTSSVGNPTLVRDIAQPTVVITDDEATPTGNLAGGDITYTFTFSEGVTGFTAADVVVANGTKGTFTAVSATVYTLVVTPTAGFEGNVTVDVAAGVAQDAAANDNTVAVQSVQAVDMLAPTVVITDDEATPTGNLAGGDITYTFTFSEGVTGFTAADVVVANGSKGTFTAVSATVYTLVVTPTAGFVGNVTVDVAAGTAQDAAGNGNTAAVQSVQGVDMLAPTVASGTTASVAENTLAATVVYNANANDGGGNDVGITYSLGGVDAALFSINASTGALTFNSSPNYEVPLDVGANNVYDVTIIATDLAGNAATQSLATTVTNVGEAGETVISLGAYGNLIAPVQVEGSWFYHWDRSGDGTNADTGSLNGGMDITTHDILDGIFNQDINGVQNTTVQNADGAFGTTEVYRYATLNGVKVALPTYGSTLDGSGNANDLGYQNGTAVNSGMQTNGTFDGLLAVWDAHNGSGTGTSSTGTPAGWLSNYYWSATPSAIGHVGVRLNGGYITDSDDLDIYYVALQVL